jgi:hypothetical protein
MPSWKPRESASLTAAPCAAPFPFKATKGSKAGATELQALEQRLHRMEQLVLLIAQLVGGPPGSDRAVAAAALPPT